MQIEFQKVSDTTFMVKLTEQGQAPVIIGPAEPNQIFEQLAEEYLSEDLIKVEQVIEAAKAVGITVETREINVSPLDFLVGAVLGAMSQRAPFEFTSIPEGGARFVPCDCGRHGWIETHKDYCRVSSLSHGLKMLESYVVSGAVTEEASSEVKKQLVVTFPGVN